MKFIGQYIHDLIARFRSDVYLEDVSSGTIASGGNLGLDSNNKIVKANEPTSHDAVTLAGTPDYITLSGQEITRNPIALADDVSGFLPVANGGTAANNVAGARASLGVDAAGTDNSTNVTLTGTPDYITISGQEITRNQIDLTADVTGTLPVGNGGTGATTLTSNSILTGNGTSAIQAESTLSYDSEILDIGADDNSAATIRRLRHTDEAGGDLYIRGGDATGTNKDGGDLQIFGGRATGNAAGGAVIIQAGETNASSGTALRGVNVVASFRSDGDTLLQGNLIFEGSVPDAHETTFSITNPTADRTITVPDATGTMCISGADGSNMILLGSGTGYVASPAAQTWHFGNSLYGFNHFNWKSVTAGMVSDSSTFTISEDYNGVGQFVPAALSKVVVRVSCRPATTSNETFKVTICSADRDAGGTNTTWTALASATNETSIGVWEACDATYTGSIATSKMLAIGVGIDESSVSTGNIRFNWQLVGHLA